MTSPFPLRSTAAPEAALPSRPGAARWVWGALLAALALGGAARADEPASTPRGGDYLLQEDDPEFRRVPQFRLELSGRGAWLLDGKLKKGRADSASTIDTGKDLHVPILPFAGVRAVFDVKIHPDVVVGLHYTGLRFRSPSRHLHKGGSGFQGRRFVAHEQTRATLDFQLSDLFFRFPARDNPRLRFAFGFGAAWARVTLRLEAPSARARGRVQELFGPTLNYLVSARLHPRLMLFLESVTAVISPLGFPSYVSEFRAGLRFPLPFGVEVVAAFCTQSAWLEMGHDLWDGAPTAGRRRRAASWTILGGDLGLSWRF